MAPEYVTGGVDADGIGILADQPVSGVPVLEHLAGGVPGQCVHDVPPAGHLGPGQDLQRVGRSSSAVASWPGRSTTKATRSSPSTGWGMPSTATSRTSGWVAMAFSTSVGWMLLPPRMMTSLLRPTM